MNPPATFSRGLAEAALLSGLAVLAGLLTLGLIACNEGSPDAEPPDRAASPAQEEVVDTVTMTNELSFAPDSIVIRAGETVLFRNTSALVHTVTADTSRASLEASVHLPEGATPFHSGRLSPGQSFSHTFETPGRYRYFCVPHEGAKMRGTVVVEPSPAGGG